MSKPRRARFIALEVLLARRRLDVPTEAIIQGRVLVDGRALTNPSAQVRADASLRVTPPRQLRGDVKLSYALDTFAVPVAGRVALDVGASAGGFTTALLDRGATLVYAVDAGVGQLNGRLRLDRRVIVLEGTNLGALSTQIVPDTLEIVTVDLSYLPLTDALPQLESVDLANGADLVALVKPTFELRRGGLAARDEDVAEAVDRVAAGIDRSRWQLAGTCAAPSAGRRGAREAFVHARRRRGDPRSRR